MKMILLRYNETRCFGKDDFYCYVVRKILLPLQPIFAVTTHYR